MASLVPDTKNTALPAYVQKKTSGNVSYYDSTLLNKGQGYLKCSKCKALFLLTFMDIGEKLKDIEEYLGQHTHLTEIVYKEKEVIKEVFIYGPDPSKTPEPLKQATGRKFR